jgi:DNA-binding NtrC family response regulator
MASDLPFDGPRQLVVHCPAAGASSIEATSKVLVIDENLRYAETLARIVSNDAYAIRLASTYARHRERLEANARWAEIVICELSAPSQEKVALLHRLRKSRPELSFVIVTATPDHPAVATFMRHSFPVVQKPFTSRELRSVLARVVSKRSGFSMPAQSSRRRAS